MCLVHITDISRLSVNKTFDINFSVRDKWLCKSIDGIWSSGPELSPTNHVHLSVKIFWIDQPDWRRTASSHFMTVRIELILLNVGKAFSETQLAYDVQNLNFMAALRYLQSIHVSIIHLWMQVLSEKSGTGSINEAFPYHISIDIASPAYVSNRQEYRRKLIS